MEVITLTLDITKDMITVANDGGEGIHLYERDHAERVLHGTRRFLGAEKTAVSCQFTPASLADAIYASGVDLDTAKLRGEDLFYDLLSLYGVAIAKVA